MSWFSRNLSNGSLEVGLPGEQPRDQRLARLEITLLSLIFVTAGVLNAGLLFVLWGRRNRLSTMRVFVFHLCIADLVVTFFQVCPQLVWGITDRFVGPDIVCRLVKYLQVVGMFASTYMIVVMTVDRYQAICTPMVKFQPRRAAGWNAPVCAAWCVALVGGLPQVFIFSRVEVAPDVFDCWADFVTPWGLRAYVTWTTLVIFVLPVLTVVACQVRICRAVQTNFHTRMRQSEHRTTTSTVDPAGGLSSRASGVGAVSRARVKTVQMTVVLVLAYVGCWAPFFTVQLWSVWDPHAPTETAAFSILMLLASLNSCANPCIYLLFSGTLPARLGALCRGGARADAKGTASHEDATRVSSPRVSSIRVSSPRVSSIRVSSIRVSSPRVSSIRVSSPKVSSIRVSSPRVSSPRVSSPRVSSPRVSSPRVSSPRVSSPRVNSTYISLRGLSEAP